ncbi:MAG: WcaI family glycosyltransferase [Hyphomicrobiales bacterium]|nr:WcaI family glycosyltransferase [Hyphomicrobiales bacterium]
MGEHFARSSHEVAVVTTIPHYPGWRPAPGYRNGRYVSEMREGVAVTRCPLLLRERMGGIWRLIAPLTFAVTSAPVALWRILRFRPDVVLCVEPTLMIAPVAVLAARLVGAKTALHVQDLEVDAAFAVGHLKGNGWLQRIASLCEGWLLRRFDRVVTISGAMAERLARKGVAADRIAIVYNWVDLDAIKPLGRQSVYRDELGFAAGDRIVLYSGAIGAKQGFEDVIDAAERLARRQDIQFVIAGEGPAKPALAERAASSRNVRFLPFQPYSRLSEFLGLADLHILPQASAAADLVLPSKLGGMLASGRRIVVTAAAGCELERFVAGAATVVPPANGEALAEAIERVVDDPRPEGAAFRRRLAERLAKSDGLKCFEALVVDWEPMALSRRAARAAAAFAPSSGEAAR